MYVVGHQYPPSNILFYVIFVAKCPHEGPSCNSFIIVCAFVVVKHHRSLLSWPILYNSPFFSVKGFTLLTNLYFCYIDNMPSIYFVFKKNYIIQPFKPYIKQTCICGLIKHTCVGFYIIR
jgi:hypothetical protein